MSTRAHRGPRRFLERMLTRDALIPLSDDDRGMPDFASTYAGALAALIERCPAFVEAERWQQCLANAERVLAQWGEQAAVLGRTERDLCGLREPPAKPHPSYRRFSRRDCIGLVWLLQGAPVTGWLMVGWLTVGWLMVGCCRLGSVLVSGFNRPRWTKKRTATMSDGIAGVSVYGEIKRCCFDGQPCPTGMIAKYNQ